MAIYPLTFTYAAVNCATGKGQGEVGSRNSVGREGGGATCRGRFSCVHTPLCLPKELSSARRVELPAGSQRGRGRRAAGEPACLIERINLCA